MRKNSIKNTRINQEVLKELSVIISREVKDPRIDPLATVTNVIVAPDLKTAKVFVSVMGNDENKKNTITGLKSAAPYIRSCLAKTVNLRNTPELKFVLDDSIEYGIHMTELINSLDISPEDEEGE